MLTGRNHCYKNLFIEYIIWYISKSGPIAQSVEQRTENPCVAGSIPAWATTFFNPLWRVFSFRVGKIQSMGILVF